MKRDYIEVKSSSWTRGFLSQFKTFFTEENVKFHKDLSLPVKGFQQIKRGVISYSVDISAMGANWANDLPDAFTFYSLTPHFDRNSDESYHRVARIIFKKQMVKDLVLICYPLNVFFAEKNRKENRTKNVSENVFVENFSLPKGKVEINTNRSFIGSLFKKTETLLKRHFSFVDINYFEDIKYPAISLVKSKLQHYWVQDYNLLNRDGDEGISTFKVNADFNNQVHLWRRTNCEIVSLGLGDLTEFEKEMDDTEEVERIMSDLAGSRKTERGDISVRKRFSGEAIYPILCTEETRDIPVGYLRVLTKNPLNEKELFLIEDQIEWLETTIITGVEFQMRAKSPVVDFSPQGISVIIDQKELIEHFQKIKRLKLRLYFIIDEDKIKVEAGAEIAFMRFFKNGNLLVGLNFKSFDPVVHPNGALTDGKSNYLFAIKHYGTQYLPKMKKK